MIKNYRDISKSKLRRDALKIVEAGLESIRPENFMSSVSLKGDILSVRGKRFNLSGFDKVFVIGYGKASGLMARELEKILKKRIYKGVVISRKKVYCSRIEILVGDHPLPGRRTLTASKRLLKLLKEVGKDDLVINLVSGGGSSLFEIPEKLKISDINKVNKILLKSGASIEEINKIRIALSSVKGGRLPGLAEGRIVSLILSDVPGNDLSFVSSGPTVPPKFDRKDLKRIVKKYKLESLLKDEVIDMLMGYKVIAGKEAVNILIADNSYALKAMEAEAKTLGYKTEVVKNVKGEARSLGVRLLRRGFRGALIAGGESSVTVKGRGKGGRNQECALGALRAVKRGEVFVSIGSDGIDNSRFAGAIVDRDTLEKAAKLGLDIERFLERNDSYNFFRKVGDYILTGDTGSNVADLFLVLRR